MHPRTKISWFLAARVAVVAIPRQVAKRHERGLGVSFIIEYGAGGEACVVDLRQIRYFMWIYEHRSFSAAARKANVAQPALSIQIRHLEEELGVTLFERSSGGAVPTDLGRKFYELCTPVRDGVDFARQQMSELASSEGLLGESSPIFLNGIPTWSCPSPKATAAR
jgi:hypothetical protein